MLGRSHRASPYLTDLLAAMRPLADIVGGPGIAWAQRPADERLAIWERRHVPLDVRFRIDAAEHRLFCVKAILAACFIGDVDPKLADVVGEWRAGLERRDECKR